MILGLVPFSYFLTLNILSFALIGFCFQAGVPKIGLWGGTRGRLHGISVAPHNLRSVIIRSGLIIDSLAFTYYDRSGQEKTAGPWGGSGGSEHTVILNLN